MNVDFHVHTNLSVDGVHSPREMVKYAKSVRLDAIAITDHNRLFSWREAKRLSKEFGILVIPGIEGGNIAIQKHWIALGIERCIEDFGILKILCDVRNEAGLSVAPHPHTRQGYENYAALGFDAVESLNGTEPKANAQIRNTRRIPEVAGSDAHSFPMLGFSWTRVEADGSLESILEAVRHGHCKPEGSTVPLPEFLQFYSLYIKKRIILQPSAAFAAFCGVISDIRRVRQIEFSRESIEQYAELR